MAKTVELLIVTPGERRLPLTRVDGGYFHGVIEAVEPGTLYFYLIDNHRSHPDPASRFQPQGVHGPSQVVGSRFPWEDGSWTGLRLRDYVIYEIHTGCSHRKGLSTR